MNDVRRCVLDASALLALLRGERGAEAVEGYVEGAVVSAVNWSEVCQRSLAAGVDIEGLPRDVIGLGLEITSFDETDAERAAELWPGTRDAGLSLGDRACLALALRLELPAVTADRSWLELDVGVEVEAVR